MSTLQYLLAMQYTWQEPTGNIELELQDTQYINYNWNICNDPKVVALLVGMQLGYAKYCWFICELDSRASLIALYIKKNWPLRKRLVPGQKVWNIFVVDIERHYVFSLDKK